MQLSDRITRFYSPTTWSAAANNARPQERCWVNLLWLPCDSCHDQALLLCEHDDEGWTVWIPGYGETVIARSQMGPIACEVA
ncbi:MAG TPA: hypothetical protein V6D46_09210 [Coleofasciculaceae cyanobacterium]